MSPAELEAALSRAAAIMLLGNRATRQERQQATAMLALLDAITSTPHKRAVALRIVPRCTDGQLPSWRLIGRSLRVSHVTAKRMCSAGLADIAVAMRTTDSACRETP